MSRDTSWLDMRQPPGEADLSANLLILQCFTNLQKFEISKILNPAKTMSLLDL